MSVVTPQPNPDTVAALLDTTWRLADAESARTDALDRKAATLASFASVLATLTATLGFRFVERLDTWWALTIFAGGLLTFVIAVWFALQALMPREYRTLGMEYIRRPPTWSEILKQPEEVRGDTMRGLVETIAVERETNKGKIESIGRSLWLLFVGPVVIAVEAVTLRVHELSS